ncbi:hypothetical protein ACHQM5_024881 [Ranunculus cassubicifolius]
MQGGEDERTTQYPDRGKGYRGHEDAHSKSSQKEQDLGSSIESSSKSHVNSHCEWSVDERGNIHCPLKELGGRSCGLLELKCLFTENWITDLEKKAEKIDKKYKHLTTTGSSTTLCSCLDSTGEIDFAKTNLLKVSSREGSDDNYLYYSTAREIQNEELDHFQKHWIRGEPVIVRNVLELGSGSSWEPMVMWRAFRDMSKARCQLAVKAIDCFDWWEVSFTTVLSLCFRISRILCGLLSRCLAHYVLSNT